MMVALQHKEVSVRKGIHCRFAKFLKIPAEVFMISDSLPMWSDVGRLCVHRLWCALSLQLVADAASDFVSV